jgi:glucuronyl/N-acetylglucosaminyl transferase EXT1
MLVRVVAQVDFAYHVWRHFPGRLIGYVSRGHYWDDMEARWRYSSAWANDYSMVLTATAFYHR